MRWKRIFEGLKNATVLPVAIADTPQIAASADLLYLVYHTTIYTKKGTIDSIRLQAIDRYSGRTLHERLIKSACSHYPTALSCKKGCILTCEEICLQDENFLSSSYLLHFDHLLQPKRQENIKESPLYALFKTSNGSIAFAKSGLGCVALMITNEGKVLVDSLQKLPFACIPHTIVQTKEGYAYLSQSDSATRLVVLDAKMRPLWHRRIGKASLNAAAMIATSDGGYALIGRPYEECQKCTYLLKLDSKGNLLYTKHFGGKLWDEVNDIIETKKNFIIVGSNLSHAKTKRVGWIVIVPKEDGQ